MNKFAALTPIVCHLIRSFKTQDKLTANFDQQILFEMQFEGFDEAI